MIDEHEVTERLRRTFDAVATRAIDDPAATVQFEETRTKPRPRRVAVALVAAAATVALVAGAVWSSTRHTTQGRVDVSSDSSTSSSVAPAVAAHPSSRIELASGTIVAGSTVSGTLVVENDTGAPIPQPKCRDARWGVYLINSNAASGPPAFADVRLCDPSHTTELAAGETRLPFTFDTTYMSCANAPDSYPPTPKCLPGDLMPPLPPGDYRVELEGAPYKDMTKPPTLTVHIVSK